MANNIVVSTGAADILPNAISDFQQVAFDSMQSARDILNNIYRGSPNSGSNDIMVDREPPPTASIGGNNPATDHIIYISPKDQTYQWQFQPLSFGNPPDTVTIDDVSMRPVTVDVGETPVAPIINIPDKPNVIYPDDLEDAPSINQLIVDSAPIKGSVTKPMFKPVSTPDDSALVVTPFTPQRPVAGEYTLPQADFMFTAEYYTSDLLDKTVAKIKEFLAGGVGIPEQIWDQIWSRENDRENRAGVKLIDEVNTNWSKRRFQLPQGAQAAQINEVQQNIQSTSVGRARDIATQEANLEIENLRFAVQQGIAMENMRGNLFVQIQAQSLEAARYAYGASIEIATAYATIFNSEVQLYLADASVYETELKARIDSYIAKLEGAKLNNITNETELKLYLGELDALKIDIDFYNAHLAEVNTNLAIKKSDIELFLADVQRLGVELQEVSIQYDAYKTEMLKPEVQSKIYQTNVDAFSALMNAKVTDIKSASTEAQIKVENNKLKIQKFSSELESYTASINAKTSELDSNVRAAQVSITKLSALIDDAKAHSDATKGQYMGEIQLRQQASQENINDANLDMQRLMEETKRVQDLTKIAIEIDAGFAAASMSAVNLSTSMSDGASNSASA